MPSQKFTVLVHVPKLADCGMYRFIRSRPLLSFSIVRMTVSWLMKRASSCSVIFMSLWLAIVACAFHSSGTLFSFGTHAPTLAHARYILLSYHHTSFWIPARLVCRSVTTAEQLSQPSWDVVQGWSFSFPVWAEDLLPNWFAARILHNSLLL